MPVVIKVPRMTCEHRFVYTGEFLAKNPAVWTKICSECKLLCFTEALLTTAETKQFAKTTKELIARYNGAHKT